MIRIEDTDQARSSDESARGILDDLAWLGIAWDDGPEHTVPTGERLGAASRPVGPFFQARRVPIYNAYIEHLVRSGHAYPAFETTEELDALRKAAAAKKATFKYTRPADVTLGVFPQARWERALRGEAHVVRFAMPPSAVVVHDEVLGKVEFAAGEVDDFVIRKADGFPTYHFAVVIDDELMGVTHVLRAQEHLMNTPRHVAMQHALTRLKVDTDAASGTDGRPFRTPFYAHMPLICNMDNSKMSKRDKAKAARVALKAAMQKDAAKTAAAVGAAVGLTEAQVVTFLSAENDDAEVAGKLAAHLGVTLPEIEVWDFRVSGYLPEAMTNFLALLGWSPGLKDAEGKDVEKFDNNFLAKNFSVERIGKGSAKFDRVKLLSFNADAVKALSDAEFLARLRAWAAQHRPGLLDGLTDAQVALLVPALKPRCRVFGDAPAQLAVFTVPAEMVAFDGKAVEKHLRNNGGAGLATVAAFRDRLAAMAALTGEQVEKTVEALAAERAVKVGDVAQPVRVALTGNTVSPPLGLTVAVFGKDEALKRLERAVQMLGR
jgi:glutamyl-tRNA synthetase